MRFRYVLPDMATRGIFKKSVIPIQVKNYAFKLQINANKRKC